MAEAKDGEEEEEYPVEEIPYDGPYIAKRIEWYSQIQRTTVELVGSWNRFKGGDMLEYQGNSTYAIDVKLPLGTYVYRFLVDAGLEGEDWETNNDLAKNIRDGVEFNVITVREDGQESEEEEEDDEEETAQDADDEGEQTLTYDESTGGFVVGKSKKKRRGRPSIEIELPTSFVQEAQAVEDTAAKTETAGGLAQVAEQGTTPGDGATAGATPGSTLQAPSLKKKKKRRKMKRRGMGIGQDDVDLKALFKQKEEEWARMVFVQQLRQQQQHNDEINRVKTLWKQERQVRVEMHKKIVQQKKKLGQRVMALEAEIEKMKEQAQIGATGEKQKINQLEEQIQKKEEEVNKVRDELRQAKEDATAQRKEKVEYEKNARQANNDWESEKKRLTGEMSRLQQEIKSLNTQNQSLQQHISQIKDTNASTRELETQRFAAMQTSWEEEKQDLLKHKETSKKLKADLEEKEAELQRECDAKRSAEQATQAANSKNEELTAKIAKMDAQIVELSDTTKTNNAIKEAVEKERQQLETEKAALTERIGTLEGRIQEQKGNFEQELEKVKQQAQADLSSLAEKTGKEATDRLDALRKEIGTRDEEIRVRGERIAALEDNLTEEKGNNAALEKRCADLSEEVEGLKKDNSELNTAKTEVEKRAESLESELKTKETEANQADETAKARIATLEGELTTAKETAAADTEQFENDIAKLNGQLETLKGDLEGKMSEASNLTKELGDANASIENLRASETTLKDQVVSLNERLEQEEKDSTEKLRERDARIDSLSAELHNTIAAKDEQIARIEEKSREVEGELARKTSEFQNAETTIAQLRAEVKANEVAFHREKESLEQQVAAANAKDERIMRICKALSAKFAGLRGEMDEIRSAKIAQLEKMNEFFPNFKDMLTKAFGFHQHLIDDLMEKYKRELTLRRKYFNIVQDLRGNIRVFCRVRPLLPFEIKKGYSSCVTFPQPGMLKIRDDKGEIQTYEFDQVYDTGTDQERVSEDTTEYVQSVMDGYNVSIFAYGQTGSGKTYTMNGPADNPGVNLRALKHIFKLAESRAPMFEYTIRVAICEIYNEQIRDLIANVQKGKKKKKKKGAEKKSKEEQKYKIRHLPDGSVEVQGLNWVVVNSDQDIIELESEAQSNRSAGITDMNAHSSRSHMLLIVDVQGFNVPANIQYLGKLYLVDLAGSERVKKSGATGQALKEAQNINKSLSALGDVMQALQNKAKFIPYRNSTLTDLMTNSLGGNAKTVMFINCCPTAEHAFETCSSLNFATRVGKVELGQAKASAKKRKRKGGN